MEQKSERTLLKAQGLLVFATTAGNFFNFLYHIYMSRNLGGPNYAALNAILSLLYILMVPVMTIQTVIARYISVYNARGQEAEMHSFFIKALKRLAAATLVLFGVMICAAPSVKSFLHIETLTPVLVGALLLLFSYLLPIFWGTLQGLERFKLLGFSFFANFLLRFLLGILLVIVGWGVAGALAGAVLGAVFALASSMLPLRGWFGRASESTPIDFGEVYRYSWPVILALLALSPYVNLDVVMARHFLAPAEAGYYATASIVGKGFLFLPTGIVMAMFPRVSAKITLEEDTRSELVKSLVLTLVLLGAGVLGCWLLSGFVAGILSRSETPALVSLIRVVGFAVMPVALTYILVYYSLARSDFRFLWVMVASALLFTVLLVFFHASPMQIVVVLGLVGLLLFIVNLSLVLTQKTA